MGLEKWQMQGRSGEHPSLKTGDATTPERIIANTIHMSRFRQPSRSVSENDPVASGSDTT
jgi:hypothetical protein